MLSGPGTDAVDMAWLRLSAMLGHVCPVEERWAPVSICSTTPQSPVLVAELVDHTGRAGMSPPPVATSPLRARGTTTNSVDSSSLGRSLLPLWYLAALTKVHRPLLKIYIVYSS